MSSSVVLPAPLGPMTTAQLFFLDIEVQAVDGLEAVEGNGQVLDGEDEAHGGAPSRALLRLIGRSRLARPSGRNMTTTMNKPPMKYSQYSTKFSEK